MAKKQITVFIKPKAEKQITAVSVYIEEKGFPFTAEKFAGKMYDFAESLALFPFGYPVCRNNLLKKKNYRCAVFHKDYIFVYKVYRDRLTIHQVIHGSRLK